MTFVNERVLIVAGHAWQCISCREKLLADAHGVLLRQGLTADERKLFSEIAPSDWSTVTSLASALGSSRTELEEALRHPRCRLRHL
ncbi:MAG TPA: hypothetical protein VM537_04960 [Anaerolineae bacterium]|jgi:hypothetical protein|nr:hypothetical protein [Anaerolineae bacterium]